MKNLLTGSNDEIRNRIEVLDAAINVATSRILIANNPSMLLDQASAIEAKAYEMLATAQRMRDSVIDANERIADIKTEKLEAMLERDALQLCLQRGIKPVRLRKVIDLLRAKLKRENEELKLKEDESTGKESEACDDELNDGNL